MQAIIYQVIDTQGKEHTRHYLKRATARKVADRKDLEYGAIRYIVRALERKSAVPEDTAHESVVLNHAYAN